MSLIELLADITLMLSLLLYRSTEEELLLSSSCIGENMLCLPITNDVNQVQHGKL